MPYKLFFELIFSRFSPETAHHLGIFFIKVLGLTGLSKLSGLGLKKSRVKALGMSFEGPFGMAAGFDKNAEFSDSLSFFKRGDTVTLKLCNIDKVTYDFWRTYEFSFQSIGNPFSSPTRILGNISNDALGYFGGYGAQYHTIIIPK